MAKTKSQKQEVLTNLAASLQAGTAVVFANVQGLTVKDSEELKKIGKKEGVKSTLVKKTLLKKVFDQIGIAADPKTFTGGVGVFVGIGEPVAPAKIVVDFAKTKDLMKIFGGIFEGKFITSSEVATLANTPSRFELLSRFVGALNSPATGFARVLLGNMRGLVIALDNIAKQKV